jgi:hypothetical protein
MGRFTEYKVLIEAKEFPRHITPGKLGVGDYEIIKRIRANQYRIEKQKQLDMCTILDRSH